MRIRPVLLLSALLGSVLTACGTPGRTASRGTAAANPAAFVLQEWSVNAPTTQLHAGKVLVTATNRGSETHELVIVRVGDAASLPTKNDGSVDEDKIPEAAKPGEIPDIKAGTTMTKTLDLARGDYVAMCNLVDTMGRGGGMGGMGNGGEMSHVHYQLGMVTTFTVT